MIDARLVGTPLEDWPFRVPLHAVDWEALALDRGDEHPPLSSIVAACCRFVRLSAVSIDKQLSRLVESTENRLDRRWLVTKLSGVTPS